MLSESELNRMNQMLGDIFKKDNAPDCIIPDDFKRILEIAKSLGVDFTGKVLIIDYFEDFGCVDFCTYNDIVIKIGRNARNMNRTLAHELGHIKHIQDGIIPNDGSGLFGICEKLADEFAYKVLNLL